MVDIELVQFSASMVGVSWECRGHFGFAQCDNLCFGCTSAGSATTLSVSFGALASLSNHAQCDTWCFGFAQQPGAVLCLVLRLRSATGGGFMFGASAALRQAQQPRSV